MPSRLRRAILPSLPAAHTVRPLATEV
jgi:hypothetical protein